MVLQLGDHDDVPGAERRQSVRIRDEVDRLGGIADEDDLARRGRVEERADLLARALQPLGGPLGELIDAAVHVRVRRLVERLHRLEHLAGLLRARRRIEVGEWLAVELLLEDREVGTDALGIQGGHGRTGHRGIVRVSSARPLVTRLDLAVRRRSLGDLPLPFDHLCRGMAAAAEPVHPDTFRRLLQQLLFQRRGEVEACGQRVRERRRSGVQLLHLRPCQLDEPVKEREGALDVLLARLIRLVLDQLDLRREEAAPTRQLDDAEASATLHDHVEAAVVEPLDHLGHRGERADGTQAVVVGIDEAELTLLGQALVDQLLVPVFEDVQRDLLRREEHDAEREEADLGHLQNYARRMAADLPDRTAVTVREHSPSARAAARIASGGCTNARNEWRRNRSTRFAARTAQRVQKASRG